MATSGTSTGSIRRPDGPDGAAPVPTVVLFHGLEGGSGSHYARALMAHLAALGWRGVIPHFRGCGGEPNRHPRAYHSGDHEEIGAMLDAVRARIGSRDGGGPLYAVGVSLGGSALVNWLGRAGRDAIPMVDAAAAVSTPLDLTRCGTAIGQGFNRIYAYHFLWTLLPKSLAMAQRFPGRLDAHRIWRVRSMHEFDDVVTAPLHGFKGTADYWHRASSKPWLRQVAVPTLVLNARNDPFVPADSLPGPADVSADVVLEQPEGGGPCRASSRPRSREISAGCRSGWYNSSRRASEERVAPSSAPGARPAGQSPCPTRQWPPRRFLPKSSRRTTFAASSAGH